jgi:polysaccharide biosynthesis/export protein
MALRRVAIRVSARTSRLASLLAPLLMAGLLAACAATPAPPLPVADTKPPTAADYVIGPGDGLSIMVYRAPEFSVDLPVRPDGRLSLPLVPDVEAAGRTSTQLAAELATRLSNYIQEPNVTVMVRSFAGTASQRIRVIGEATQPKALPYREGMTLLDVMIEVGGLTRYAAGNRAELMRRDPLDAPPQTFRLRLSDLLRDGDTRQDLAVRPGDTIVIPQSWF